MPPHGSVPWRENTAYDDTAQQLDDRAPSFGMLLLGIICGTIETFSRLRQTSAPAKHELARYCLRLFDNKPRFEVRRTLAAVTGFKGDGKANQFVIFSSNGKTGLPTVFVERRCVSPRNIRGICLLVPVAIGTKDWLELR